MAYLAKPYFLHDIIRVKGQGRSINLPQNAPSRCYSKDKSSKINWVKLSLPSLFKMSKDLEAAGSISVLVFLIHLVGDPLQRSFPVSKSHQPAPEACCLLFQSFRPWKPCWAKAKNLRNLGFVPPRQALLPAEPGSSQTYDHLYFYCNVLMDPICLSNCCI